MSHQPRRRFGQHFLRDPHIIARILGTIDPQPEDHLVEIGPGGGAITLGLLRAAGRLDAIELDRDLAAPLVERCRDLGALRLFVGDALAFDFTHLVANGERLRVVGNLPYNISTPLLFHLLDQASVIEDMHLMLQREVVDRMGAAPGSRERGRLSIMLQAHCEVVPLFSIGADAFSPPPKVESAFVRLRPHRQPPHPVEDWAWFAALVARAFGQRRKTLRNSLRQMVPENSLRACGIRPEQRAEELSVADFARLANAACNREGTPRDNLT
jgi:16S rRNA (adenine1518-N6/adenine1519-N6)-dimethyltransferase